MSIVVRGPLIFRLLARMFPLRERLPEGQSLADLRRKYRKWEIINTLEYLVLAAGAVYGVHAALVAYGAHLAKDESASVYTLRPGPEFWYFPALLAGSVLAGVLVHLLNRVMLPEGGLEFRIYANVNAGFNASCLFAWTGIVVLAFGALLSYFAASNAVHLRQNDMVIHRLWSFGEETHAYAEIKALKEIHDSQNNRDDFEIDFEHADPFTSQIEVVFFDAAQKNFLVERSEKPIQKLTRQ